MSSWEEIVASESFQAIPEGERESVRDAYFDQNIAPSLTPEDDPVLVREAFDEKTKDTDLIFRQEKYEQETGVFGRMGMRLKGGMHDVMSAAAASSVADDQLDIEKLDAKVKIIEDYEAGKGLPEDSFAQGLMDESPERFAQWLEKGKSEIPKERAFVEKKKSQHVHAMRRQAKEGAAIPRAPVSEAVTRAKNFDEAWDMMKLAPVSFIAEVGTRSLPMMAVPIIKGIAGGLVAGPVGFAAGMGSGSFTVERAASLNESMIEKLHGQGVDINNEQAILKAISEPEFFEVMKQDANTRGLIIGYFDALSGGLASKTMAPAAIKKAMARELFSVTAQMPVQGALGGLGEASAQYVTEGELRAGEIMGEIAGEFIQAPGEVLSATLAGVRGQSVEKVKADIESDENLKQRKADLDAKADEYREAKDAGATELELEAREEEIMEDSTKFMEEATAAHVRYEEEERMIKGLERELGFAEMEEVRTAEAIQRDRIEVGIEKPAMEPPKKVPSVAKAVAEAAAIETKKTEAITRKTETQMQKALREAASGIDQAAAEVDTQPTEAQKESGNYKKGHVSVQGLPVAIENPKGSVRTGEDEGGQKWTQKMQSHYGYIKKSEGADGDHVDVFLADGAESADTVFVVNQNNPYTGKFDEHKVVIGPTDAKAAEAEYLGNYAEDWAGFDSIVEMSVPEFKAWLKGDTTKPAQQAEVAKLAPKPAMAPPTEAERLAEPKFKKAEKKPAPEIRVPKPEEKIPVVALGRVEREMVSLFKRTVKPAAKALSNIFGSPRARKGKEKLDENVKPTTYAKLKEYLEWSMENDHDGDWYNQFGTGIAGVVGDTNMAEASIIFGITSAQNAAEQNLADTLHIMAVARGVDPAIYPDQFKTQLREGRRPDGQKLKITGAQIDKVADMYITGTTQGGLKVTSYMQNIKDAALNLFSPHTVQDVHMARIFGFMYRDVDKKTGNVVDMAKFPSDSAIRYGQFLTMRLAEEYDIKPHEAQAYLWFYAKKKLSPKKVIKGKKKVGAGTWESAQEYSQPEITAIESVIDKTKPISKVFIDPKAPGYKAKVISDPYSNTDFNDALMDLARKRAPRVTVSATPGTERGLAFEDVSFDQLRQYGTDVMTAITDETGQIKILRAMGIPHEVREIVGTWDRMEPTFEILLPGGNLDDAKSVAALLGDAFLQDAAIAAQPDYEGQDFGIVARKKDGTKFTSVELAEIYDKINVEHSVDGLNFSSTHDDTGLKFIDGSFYGAEKYTDQDLVAFAERLVAALGDDYVLKTFAQKGDMYDKSSYEAEIEGTWSRFGKQKRSDLQRAAQRELYEPIRKIYNRHYKSLEGQQGSIASPVSLSRLTLPEAAQQEIYGRFGSFRDNDTTESLKIYDLDELIADPSKVGTMLNDYQYEVKTFSFHEDPAAGVEFVVPKLKKEHYGTGVLWIYDPRVAHGSFKDEEYTRMWRTVHELGHGITDRIMQKKYGDSRREGRMGRTWNATRGHPSKRQVTVELEPLTLLEAQRAVEWEDVSFRVQRMLMEDLGITVDPVDFGREYNTNIGDALHRVLTGDFGDPGEYGFVPRETLPSFKSIMGMLEKTEKSIAKTQNRESSEGIDMGKWERFTQDELRSEMDSQKKKPMLRKGGKGRVTVQDLNAHVSQLTNQWKNAPHINVVENHTHLPAALKDFVEKLNAQDDVDGLYDPITGNVYLIADGISNVDHATKVIFHEVLGHAGLRGTMGNDIVPFLRGVFKANREEMNKVALDYDLDLNNPADRLVAAEEWLAMKAETSPRNSYVRQLISWIRQWMRKMFAGLKVTDDEVLGALGRMRSSMIDGSMQWQVAKAIHPLLSRFQKPFYSHMESVLTDKLPGKGTGQSYTDTINAFVKKGVIKSEEVEWSGVMDWLAEQDEKISKADVLDYVKANKIEVQEVIKEKVDPNDYMRSMFHVFEGDDGGFYAIDISGKIEGEADEVITHSNSGEPVKYGETEEEAWNALESDYLDEDNMLDSTKYHDHQLAGGENYREILIQLPSRMVYIDNDDYFGSHFKEDNIIAHVRMNERTDIDGKKVLFLEEVQSDWHQAGRKKGYKAGHEKLTSFQSKMKDKYNEQRVGHLYKQISSDDKVRWDTLQEAISYGQVPDAPFRTTWPLLAMKRMIRYAAENGFDKIAWTTGEQQAARYDLSKQMDSITTFQVKDGVNKGQWNFVARKDDEIITAGTVPESELENHVGKDLAEKIISTPESQTFSGIDLKVGGRGMLGFYDQILPKTVNKYVKKWGAKTITTNLPDPLLIDAVVHSVDVTPKMREAALNGQPLFSRGANRNTENSPEASDQSETDVNEANDKTYKDRVMGWIHQLDNKIDGFGDLVDLESYRESRGKLQALIQQGQDSARLLYETFNKLSEAESLNVFEYLTDRDAKPSIIEDETVRMNAIKAKNIINSMGQMMVSRGIIPAASHQNFESRYLPRVYLAYLLGDKAIKTIGAGKKLSKQGYAMRRSEHLTKEYREVILGEIKDPAFLLSRAIGIPSRDLAIMEFFDKILQNPNWVLQDQLVQIQIPGTDSLREVTPFWLQNEAKRLRAMSSQLSDSPQKNKMDSLASQYEKLAADVQQDEQFDAEEYERIPDTPQYGILRGLIVKRAIYDDIAGSGASLQDNPDAWMKLFGQGGTGTKITQMWKVMKVSLNPPSQVRNLVSNWVLLNLSGVPIHKMIPLLIRALSEIRKGGQYYKVAQEYGITAGTFSANELAAIEREFVDLQARAKGKMSIPGLLSVASTIIEKAGDIYQHAEVLSKVAKIIHEVETKGNTPALAAQEANRWLFDYSAVNKFIRTARNAPIGIPFLTFYMKVLPRLMEVAATAPWRFAPYYLMLKGLGLLAASMNDVEDDDIEALKESMPSWLIERGHAVILPRKDEQGRWMATNLGYFFPWTAWTDLGQDVGEITKGMITGEPVEARNLLQGAGVFGSPLSNLITASMTNIDPFTRKEIVRDGDLPFQQMLSRANYAYTLMAPPWMTSGGPLAKIARAGSGYKDRWGNPQPTLAQSMARVVGVNIYPIQPERSRAVNLKFMKRDLQDIKSRMKYELKDPNLSTEDRRDLSKNFRDRIKQKMKQIRDYEKRSAVHPNLR